MAYDPSTGKWTDEDTGVANRMTALTAKNNPYMQQAETRGLRTASRRGLLNSSMAVQAGEAARLDAALPIASQEASQANERVMQGRQLQSTDVTQKRGLASNEALTREGYGLQRDLQGNEIKSREGMQRAGFGHETAMQKAGFGHETAMQTRGFGHETALQKADLASRAFLQSRDLDNRTTLQNMDLASRERMQASDNQTRMQMQSLDAASQQRIANMNVSAGERSDAMRAAAALESTYAGTIQSIMNNPDIPPEARQSYIDHANRNRANNYSVIEQMYGIDLNWEAA